MKAGGGAMRGRYLEVTFRKGKALAAYLYLPRASGVKSVRTAEIALGVLADYGPGGEVIGLEITAPGKGTAETIDRVLAELGQPPLEAEELAPLASAA
jgi:uncharacterized protein YuzE